MRKIRSAAEGCTYAIEIVYRGTRGEIDNKSR
jgi:hypothetical protein